MRPAAYAVGGGTGNDTVLIEKRRRSGPPLDGCHAMRQFLSWEGQRAVGTFEEGWFSSLLSFFHPNPTRSCKLPNCCHRPLPPSAWPMPTSRPRHPHWHRRYLARPRVGGRGSPRCRCPRSEQPPASAGQRSTQQPPNAGRPWNRSLAPTVTAPKTRRGPSAPARGWARGKPMRAWHPTTSCTPPPAHRGKRSPGPPVPPPLPGFRRADFFISFFP